MTALRSLSIKGEIAELIWEVPDDLAPEHNHVHQAALLAYQDDRADPLSSARPVMRICAPARHPSSGTASTLTDLLKPQRGN
jgi:hypothetical protein